MNELKPYLMNFQEKNYSIDIITFHQDQTRSILSSDKKLS